MIYWWKKYCRKTIRTHQSLKKWTEDWRHEDNSSQYYVLVHYLTFPKDSLHLPVCVKCCMETADIRVKFTSPEFPFFAAAGFSIRQFHLGTALFVCRSINIVWNHTFRPSCSKLGILLLNFDLINLIYHLHYQTQLVLDNFEFIVFLFYFFFDDDESCDLSIRPSYSKLLNSL